MCRWSLPGEPVLLVVAEDLAVGSSGERGVDRRHVAAGVIAALATEDKAATAHRRQAEVAVARDAIRGEELCAGDGVSVIVRAWSAPRCYRSTSPDSSCRIINLIAHRSPMIPASVPSVATARDTLIPAHFVLLGTSISATIVHAMKIPRNSAIAFLHRRSMGGFSRTITPSFHAIL